MKLKQKLLENHKKQTNSKDCLYVNQHNKLSVCSKVKGKCRDCGFYSKSVNSEDELILFCKQFIKKINK